MEPKNNKTQKQALLRKSMQNINYFDDVAFLQVNRVVSKRDGAASLPHDFWGLGLMLAQLSHF